MTKPTSENLETDYIEIPIHWTIVKQHGIETKMVDMNMLLLNLREKVMDLQLPIRNTNEMNLEERQQKIMEELHNK